MFQHYWQVLFNKDAYLAWRATIPGVTPVSWFEKYKAPIKAICLAFGGAVIAGKIDLGPNLGWLAPALIGLQGFIQKNPNIVAAVATMTDSQKDAAVQHLEARAGAPDAIAAVPLVVAPVIAPPVLQPPPVAGGA